MYLLDANVLLQGLFQNHPDHHRAVHVLHQFIPHGWASCPLTESAFCRVGAQMRFYTPPMKPDDLRALLKKLVQTSAHSFWKEEISILDDLIISIPGHGAVTDLYLLALAVKNGGKLVTFNQRIPADCVKGGKEALIVVS